MSEKNPFEGLQFDGPELDGGEFIMDAVVIARVQSMDNGRSRVVAYRSHGLDDIVETGLLQIHTARDMTAWTGAGLARLNDDD
jgi:hypothetical protein